VTPARLARLVLEDLRRNRTHLGLASIGIVVGIAAFTFFLALGAGVKRVVLGEIFPIDKLEVVPKTLDVDLGPLKMGLGADDLDQAAVERLRAIPGVRGAYPKMKLTVPAIATGGEKLLGRPFATELVADGIDPALVAGDVAPGYEFRDFEDPADPRNTAARVPCTADTACPAHQYCEDLPKGAPLTTPRVCLPYIPVLISNHLHELYNGSIARAHGLPRINPEFAIGITGKLWFGESMISKATGTPIRRRGMLVGFSARAMTIGATLPIGYVKRMNVAFGGPEAATRYHSVLLEVDKDRITAVAGAVSAAGFSLEDTGAERAGLMIAVFMLVFGLIGATIVGIAAVNIMHTFFMIIYERKREIGILRAVGASRADIRRLILGEAAAVGLATGTLGVGTALAFARLCDFVSARWLPDFPYKPASYFSFSPALVGAALGFAVLFCLVGAFFPARRAAALDPAAVLSAP